MKKGKPFLIIVIALAVVVIASLLPLERWSGGHIRNFSLFSDILKEMGVISHSDPSEEQVDPALLEAMEAERESNPLTASDSTLAAPVDTIVQEPRPSRQGDMVVIEDYTTSGMGLVHFGDALRRGQLARMAVVGDSWIEGDIFTQDLRRLMQDQYGGNGVGYVSMHSDFPGFRRSVKQGGKGWKIFMANKKAKAEWLGLSEQYGIPETGVSATATYAGTQAGPHTASWQRSRFLFLSPSQSVISVKTDAGEWEERNISPSDSVQCIEVAGTVGNFELKTSSSDVVGLGVWLDGESGVSLDCMSSRGFSGITLTRISPELCRQMARFVDYRLIVLEFGINAMSSSQKDYSVYCSRMVDVINHVRRCYPRADILLMGVGDRGEKRGGQVVSMATAPAMIQAQRDAARRAHCLFWDTREAMGGEGAVVEWSRAGHINKDYIHMTHSGGERLAKELFNAIRHSLSQNNDQQTEN